MNTAAAAFCFFVNQSLYIGQVLLLIFCKHCCQEFWKNPLIYIYRSSSFLIYILSISLISLVMEMAQWSPQHAMNAYLNTLHLARVLGGSRSDEPKCMEFLSALAAGNGAKLIVQVTSEEGITPLTLALAVATKQTEGRFICIIPHCHHHHHHHHHHHNDDEAINNRTYIELINPDLKDVIEFVAGNPYEIIRQFKKIDFIVIDSEFVDLSKLWKNIDVNQKGSLLVVTNLQRGRKHVFREIVKGSHEIITLPVGDGIELLKIHPLVKPAAGKPRRYRRFHVTYEN